MVNDHKALDAGVCRYIGRRWDATLHGFPATDTPSEVEALPEYVLAVQNGDLAPADEKTAKYCGVTWVKPSKGETASVPDTQPYDGKY